MTSVLELREVAVGNEGTALLVVEHQVGHAVMFADRGAILSHGPITWTQKSRDAASVVHQSFDPAPSSAPA